MAKRRRAQGEGGLYRRGDGRWEAVVNLGYAEDGRRLRRKVIAPTQGAAITRLHEIQAEHAGGMPVEAAHLTVGSWLRTWLADYAYPSVEPLTFKSYKGIVEKHIIPSLEMIPLRKLNSLDVTRLLNAKSKSGLSPRSVQMIRATLRRALRIAQTINFVSQNAASLAQGPRVEYGRPKSLTADEARAVLAAIKGHELEAFFVLALQSGARRAEMLGLRWSDIDLDRREMHIERSLLKIAGRHEFRPTKTAGSVRRVMIAEEVCASLRTHKARQAEARLAVGPAWEGEEWGGLVFCNTLGAPVDPTGVTKQFKRILAQVGRPDLSLRNARHTSATLTYAATGDLKVVQARLGHAALGTTSRFYADVPDQVARNASDANARVLFGGARA